MSAPDDLLRDAGLDRDDPVQRLGFELAAADLDLIDRLVDLRLSKHLTQKQVAERINRDPAVISNFERLGADPRLSTVRRYARAIGARVVHTVLDADPGGVVRPPRYSTELSLDERPLVDLGPAPLGRVRVIPTTEPSTVAS